MSRVVRKRTQWPEGLPRLADGEVEPDYVMRFVPVRYKAELVNLYHLAQIALAHKPLADRGKWGRMIWARDTFLMEHPELQLTRMAVYKDLDGLLS